jgi:XTP/dITP diphosphohydrolase
MKQLVLASSNPGKLREFNALLEPAGIEVLPQSTFSIPDADEPHGTFIENALAKARHASRLARLPAMSDDSGICVRALDGAPGVRSARFAAPPSTSAPAPERAKQDRLNNEKLISLLSGQADRRAHYYCVIVLVRHADDPEPLVADGAWHGEIIDSPRGANGFGYDPYFLLPDLGQTAAEMDPAQKNAISHRGKAMRRLLARIKEGI